MHSQRRGRAELFHSRRTHTKTGECVRVPAASAVVVRRVQCVQRCLGMAGCAHSTRRRLRRHPARGATRVGSRCEDVMRKRVHCRDMLPSTYRDRHSMCIVRAVANRTLRTPWWDPPLRPSELRHMCGFSQRTQAPILLRSAVSSFCSHERSQEKLRCRRTALLRHP
jgi:hypothetical protein